MELFIKIPTYDAITELWSHTEFTTREDFVQFLRSIFKEPGKYEFDQTSLLFNSQAKQFNSYKFYCAAPIRSRDFIQYWDFEKEKCRMGVIFKNKENTWYLTRDYYMWLNFLPIYNKEIARFGFADVRDAQYHMALYEDIAKYSYKHVAILKKRQIASSYFHAAKMINGFWFEEGWINKIAASLKDFINEKGTWRFLDEYRNFLNTHTAWYRPTQPDKTFNWEQKIEITQGGRKKDIGLKSVMIGVTLEKDPINGVGGPCSFFFHEEAGVAPRMNETLEYLLPALKSGMVYTGMFAVAGSVGDLDQCEPLRDIIFNPDSKDVLAVSTNLINENGDTALCGLFIPEQWSMIPCIDKWGNSLVENSLDMILEERKKWKKDLKSNDYQLRVSQKPINIEEAFAYRKSSVWPLHLITSQLRRIEDKEYYYETVELTCNDKGEIEAKPTKRLPIMEFPLSPRTENKEGAILMWEKPIKDAPWGTYYASIDPIGEGKAEHVDNMLYTPTGRKRIGDIQIGDKVIGSNGESTNVIGIYPQGIKKMCNITFSDGHSIKVCEDHLWNVKLNGGTKGYITLSVKDLLNETKTITYTGIGRNIKKEYTISTYYKDAQNRNKWSIPIIENPVMFQPETLKKIDDTYSRNVQPVHPYILGALLGDGGLSQRSIRFSSVDSEIVAKIQEDLSDDLELKKVKGSGCDYTIVTKKGNRNSLTKILRDLNLMGLKSEHKFIPNQYKYALSAQRIRLLQGLLDTDGSCTNHGVEFYSSSKQLAYDVVELVQGLGGIAKIRLKKTTHLDSYIVRVNLPRGIDPFYLSRKKNKYVRSKIFSRYITNIKYAGESEAVCISVDAPDNLYVTEHALVTHNTTTSDSLCSIFIYKTPLQITKKKIDGTIENHIEQDHLVASWCGRYDDINKTHELLEKLIEYYGAWTIVENNISLFIQHMIHKKKQHYMVPKSQILFLKDLGSNNNVFQEYGWRNTGNLFKSHLISYGINFLTEELDVETKPDGTVVKTTYGIERIKDPILLKEMQQYREGLNVDRLVAFCALVAFAKVQQSNRGYAHKIETETNPSQRAKNSDNLTKLNRSPFRNLGKSSLASGGKVTKQAFRNLK